MGTNKVIEFVEQAIKNNYTYDPQLIKGFSDHELKEALSMLLLRVESRERELRQMVGTLENRVTERTKELTVKNLELEKLATHDDLTKLNNRRFFNEKLIEYSLLTSRFGYELSCIMADIDHFKRVNDTYGHQAGDYVLSSLASILRTNVRRTDICARYGGEEFVILLPNTSIENAVDLAEKIRIRIEDTEMNYQGVILKITASFGVAAGLKDEDLNDALVKKADDKLYQAKQTGRNKVCW